MSLAVPERIPMWQRWQTNWRRALEHIKPHSIPLAIVLLACAIGQAAILQQQVNILQWPDTVQYLAVERRILTAHQFADPLRTPGYPAFLALVYGLSGGELYHRLELAQAGLMVLAAVEVYILAYRLCGRRWAACVIAALIGANLYILDWERLVLSETLAYWMLVTMFLLLERYLRTERTTTLIWLAVLAAAAILTRPIFIFLPVALLLVLVVWSARSGKLRKLWKGLALSFAVSYGLILAYMAVNAATYGYFGLSDISNLNLFAKVLELHRTYGMPVAGANSQFAQFQHDVSAYLASGHSDVWAFVQTHPRWDAHYWSIYGTYSIQVLVHHPSYYLRATFDDVWKAWTIRPGLWAPVTKVPPWIHALSKISILQVRAYYVLPLLLIAMATRVWRRPHRIAEVVLLAMLVCVAGQILMAGALDFTEYDRLRFPVDWAMTSVAWIVTVDLLAVAAGALRRSATAIGSDKPGLAVFSPRGWLQALPLPGMPTRRPASATSVPVHAHSDIRERVVDTVE